MKFQYSTTDWFVDITRMLWIAVVYSNLSDWHATLEMQPMELEYVE